jgi:chemotaxis protein histidine kinase CheA
MSLHKFAEQVAANGRGEDSLLVHMTPDEVRNLQKFAQANGTTLTINPTTGLPEAGLLSDLFKAVAPIALGAFLGPAGVAFGGPGLSAVMAGAATGGITALATGSLSRGLMAGLGAYGGAGLGESLMNAGTGGLAAADIGAQQLAGSFPTLAEGATQEQIAKYATDVGALRDTAVSNAGNAGFMERASAGLGAIANNPAPYAKDLFKYGAAAASPLMADMMVPTTTQQPNIQGNDTINQFIYGPNGQYRSLNPVPAKNYGTPAFKPFAEGGIVALAHGGLAGGGMAHFDAGGAAGLGTLTQSAPSYTQYTDQQIGDYLRANPTADIAAATKATNADPNAVNAYIAGLTGGFTGSTNTTAGSGTTGIYNRMQELGIDPNEYYSAVTANDPNYAGWSQADIAEAYQLNKDALDLSGKLKGNVTDTDWAKLMDTGNYSVNDMAQTFGLSTGEVQNRYDTVKKAEADAQAKALAEQNAAAAAAAKMAADRAAADKAAADQAAAQQAAAQKAAQDKAAADAIATAQADAISKANAEKAAADQAARDKAAADKYAADKAANDKAAADRAVAQKAALDAKYKKVADEDAAAKAKTKAIADAAAAAKAIADKAAADKAAADKVLANAAAAKKLAEDAAIAKAIADKAAADAAAAANTVTSVGTVNLGTTTGVKQDTTDTTTTGINTLATTTPGKITSNITTDGTYVGTTGTTPAVGTKVGTGTIAGTGTEASTGTTGPIINYGNTPGFTTAPLTLAKTDIAAQAAATTAAQNKQLDLYRGFVTQNPNATDLEHANFLDKINLSPDIASKATPLSAQQMKNRYYDAKYNKMTGDSQSAYNFLMGKGAYPTKSGVGQIARPYAEATLGYPVSTNQEYIFDPATKTYSLNRDYVAKYNDPTGGPNYLMSPNEIAAYFKANQGQDDTTTYAWAVENNLTPQEIAAATGVPLSTVAAKWRDAKAKKDAAAKTAADAATAAAGKTSVLDASSTGGNAGGGLMGFAMGGMPMTGYAVGGGLGALGSYSDGGRLLRGPGDGVSDSIPATIGRKQQPARLADGEFVVPARIVSELGNGSTEAGAKKLYAMMDRVQRARGKTTGKNKIAANSRADKYLPA